MVTGNLKTTEMSFRITLEVNSFFLIAHYVSLDTLHSRLGCKYLGVGYILSLEPLQSKQQLAH